MELNKSTATFKDVVAIKNAKVCSSAVKYRKDTLIQIRQLELDLEKERVASAFYQVHSLIFTFKLNIAFFSQTELNSKIAAESSGIAALGIKVALM